MSWIGAAFERASRREGSVASTNEPATSVSSCGPSAGVAGGWAAETPGVVDAGGTDPAGGGVRAPGQHEREQQRQAAMSHLSPHRRDIVWPDQAART